MLTAIVPDPDFLHGSCRKEIHAATPEGLSQNLREWIMLDTGYGASDIGSQFSVYRDGNVVGTLTYNGKFFWRDPAYKN